MSMIAQKQVRRALCFGRKQFQQSTSQPFLSLHPSVVSAVCLSNRITDTLRTTWKMASFGMMNEAYFVGKRVLIDWVNNFLEINIEKVEQMANGAIYCNLFDAIHPGTIPMSRVDFTVTYEYDFMKNWKLVQTAFQKAGTVFPRSFSWFILRISKPFVLRNRQSNSSATTD